jgi:hypothetical protein
MVYNKALSFGNEKEKYYNSNILNYEKFKNLSTITPSFSFHTPGLFYSYLDRYREKVKCNAKITDYYFSG